MGFESDVFVWNPDFSENLCTSSSRDSLKDLPESFAEYFLLLLGLGLYLPIMDQSGILDLHQRNKWKTRGRSAAISGVYM